MRPRDNDYQSSYTYNSTYIRYEHLYALQTVKENHVRSNANMVINTGIPLYYSFFNKKLPQRSATNLRKHLPSPVLKAHKSDLIK